MKTPFKREIEVNCIIPFPLGVAYRDFIRGVTVCYPIPLNLIVRWTLRVYWWFGEYGEMSWKERAELAESALKRNNERHDEVAKELQDYKMREAYPDFYKKKS